MVPGKCTEEVLNNILESYPIGKLIAVLAAVAIALSLVCRRAVACTITASLPSWRQRGISVALLSVLAAVSLFWVDHDHPRGQGGNAYQRELASNGPYQFLPRSVITN